MRKSFLDVKLDSHPKDIHPIMVKSKTSNYSELEFYKS